MVFMASRYDNMIQQVLGLVLNHENCLGIKLSGHKDFRKWYKSLLRLTLSGSPEWNEYMRGDGMQSAIRNYSLESARELNTKSLFDEGLFSLIRNTSEGNALDFVNEFEKRCENNFINSEPWSRLHLVLKSDINERIKYAKEMADVCYDLDGRLTAILTPRQKTIFEEVRAVKRN
ncbi:hypothetical protein SUVZ_06G1110 [Saccharomyces uvarum]|uniref:Uncharacterized protein n=1 Tax=Saccharomyces uvarum TaxID=230603 RepID=A0ABN8WXZ0_SACUV|nr:hypothetical protein SUVZ_06G1110 [Saccharomyces uvarum]